MTLLEAALSYAAEDLWVFTVSQSKKPLKDTHSFKDASTDPATITAMWAKHPKASLALSTGWHETGPNLIVIDVDGDKGRADLKVIKARCGPLPRSRVVSTPSGGLHYYYTLPEGVRMKSFARSKNHEGIDLRADGGLVVLPPSCNKVGIPYTVAVEEPIAELPAPWIEALMELGARPTPAAKPVAPVLEGEPPSWLGIGASGLTERIQKLFIKSELREFLEALKLIDPNCSYDDWFCIGASIYNFDPSEDGLAIFIRWSMTCSRLDQERDERSCRDKWEREYPKGSKGKPRTAKSIYDTAADIRAEQARTVLDAPPTAPVEPTPSPTRAAPESPLVPSPAPLGTGTESVAVSTETKTESKNTLFANAPEPKEEQHVNGTASTLAGGIFAETIYFPDLDHKKRPKATCRNARVAIRSLGLACEHDTFHSRMTVGGQAIGQWAGELTDDAVHMLRVVIERQYHFDPGLTSTHDAAVQECLLEPYDPVAEYLDSLTWDGRARLDTWMADYLGAEVTPFNCAVSRLSLVAAVRRVRQPGYKFDQIIVLEGPEGRGKSSAIEILAGTGQFSDQSILTLDDKGQQEALQGVWLYEIADLAGHSRAEVERVKAFASRTVDRARPAYGRSRVDRPRRCIFFATTNSDTYLKSQTGNRRFWPVRCERIALDGLKQDRDQLWAEAVRIEATASLTLPEVLWDDATVEQDTRRDRDPWEDSLAHIKAHKFNRTDGLEGLEYRVTTRDLFEIWLKLSAERQNDVAAKRLCFTMRRLGWEGPKTFRILKATYRGYTKKAVIGEEVKQGDSQEPVTD